MKELISVLVFLAAFIIPMTALFVWLFIRPVLKEPDSGTTGEQQAGK